MTEALQRSLQVAVCYSLHLQMSDQIATHAQSLAVHDLVGGLRGWFRRCRFSGAPDEEKRREDTDAQLQHSPLATIAVSRSDYADITPV